MDCTCPESPPDAAVGPVEGLGRQGEAGPDPAAEGLLPAADALGDQVLLCS